MDFYFAISLVLAYAMMAGQTALYDLKSLLLKIGADVCLLFRIDPDICIYRVSTFRIGIVPGSRISLQKLYSISFMLKFIEQMEDSLFSDCVG